MSETKTIKLKKPIQSFGQDVSEITLREPVGRDLMKAGSVMIISGEGTFEFNQNGMGKLIGECATLPINAVESLSAGDFMACATWLVGFLAATESP